MKTEVKKVYDRIGEWKREIAELERKIYLGRDWLTNPNNVRPALKALKKQIKRPSRKPKKKPKPLKL